jgi:hypothetical protein
MNSIVKMVVCITCCRNQKLRPFEKKKVKEAATRNQQESSVCKMLPNPFVSAQKLELLLIVQLL